MNWQQAIDKCPSNINGICRVRAGKKKCTEQIEIGRCPIKQLENHEKDKAKQYNT